jgi:reversibly glycosylated polypeptide / UDP-arabinopyranose mutase
MVIQMKMINKIKNGSKKPISNVNIFIVIPTIRELTFLEDWKDQFDRTDVALIICEDRSVKSVSVPKIGAAQYHYSWKEIDADLGKDSWIIPRKVSAIRNYGFLQAVKLGAEYILTLDDDCYPVPNHNWVDLHVANLSLSAPARWTNTNPDARHMYTRGMPYLNRVEQPVMLSHGVWTNVLDHDAPTHLQTLQFRSEFAEHFLQIIPNGAYFPLCSMNFAFRAELTPLMYFPLMGEDAKGNKWGFDRFDDIWAGIFAKKVMDHLGLGVVNGVPMVEHRKASDPFVNLQKEAAGITVNEVLWQAVDRVELEGKSAVECYAELAEKIDFEWVVSESKLFDEVVDEKAIKYFSSLSKAMTRWSKLFKNLFNSRL